jgi:cytochrome d ubiquinol oxidase subunit II
VTLANAVALVLLVGVTLYAVFGGADFGSGFWDLTAGGATHGARVRALIDVAIGPVWEANHVWLIFCLVVLWTAFSPAFAAIMTVLFVPLTLAALGIVLRGAGFAFRRSAESLGGRRAFGAVFAASSVITPFFFGSRRVPTVTRSGAG